MNGQDSQNQSAIVHSMESMVSMMDKFLKSTTDRMKSLETRMGVFLNHQREIESSRAKTADANMTTFSAAFKAFGSTNEQLAKVITELTHQKNQSLKCCCHNEDFTRTFVQSLKDRVSKVEEVGSTFMSDFNVTPQRESLHSQTITGTSKTNCPSIHVRQFMFAKPANAFQSTKFSNSQAPNDDFSSANDEFSFPPAKSGVGSKSVKKTTSISEVPELYCESSAVSLVNFSSSAKSVIRETSTLCAPNTSFAERNTAHLTNYRSHANFDLNSSFDSEKSNQFSDLNQYSKISEEPKRKFNALPKTSNVEAETDEEKVIFENDCKLCVFDKTIYTKGEGVIKILLNINENKYRLFMRDSLTDLCCLNMPLVKNLSIVDVINKKDIAGVFPSSENLQNPKRTLLYMIRFLLKDEYVEFKNKFNEICGPTQKSFNVVNSGKNEDKVFDGEKKDPEDTMNHSEPAKPSSTVKQITTFLGQLKLDNSGNAAKSESKNSLESTGQLNSLFGSTRWSQFGSQSDSKQDFSANSFDLKKYDLVSEKVDMSDSFEIKKSHGFEKEKEDNGLPKLTSWNKNFLESAPTLTRARAPGSFRSKLNDDFLRPTSVANVSTASTLTVKSTKSNFKLRSKRIVPHNLAKYREIPKSNQQSATFEKNDDEDNGFTLQDELLNLNFTILGDDFVNQEKSLGEKHGDVLFMDVCKIYIPDIVDQRKFIIKERGVIKILSDIQKTSLKIVMREENGTQSWLDDEITRELELEDKPDNSTAGILYKPGPIENQFVILRFCTANIYTAFKEIFNNCRETARLQFSVNRASTSYA